MLNKFLLVIAAILLMVCFGFRAQAQTVSTNAELLAAIDNATAGTTITLVDGVWTDVIIDINKTGTMVSPITIEAQTPGNVSFEGNSRVSLGGSYIVFKDIIFQNASGLITSSNRIEPIIEFRDSGNNECTSCMVTNIKVDSYNGTVAQELNTFKWIIVYGQFNEISYSSFIGKHGIGSIINDNRNATSANFSEPDFTKIHHNYFASRTPVGEVNAKNDQDAIRIGNSSTSLHPSNTEVFENFFYDWSGEIEIISNKSGENIYYNNTFRDYQGALTLRHGDNCEVYGNFFFGQNNPLASGIRVIGEGHKEYNNYIEGTNYKKPSGAGSNATGAINITNGRQDSELKGYFQVKNAIIINNTLVNCDLGIRVGTKVKSDLSLPPENLIIANNIMVNSSNKALQQTTAPIGTSKYEGNITQNGSWDLTNGTNNNQTVTSGLLISGTDFYRTVTGSAAINAGVGSYSFLTKDILDGNRTTAHDAGAEEFGANGTRRPYVLDDLGKKVGFGASEFILNVGENSFKKNGIVLFPVPSYNQNITIQSKKKMIGKVEIYDIKGRLLSVRHINNSTGQIDTAFLSKGTYLAKIQGAYGRFIIL